MLFFANLAKLILIITQIYALFAGGGNRLNINNINITILIQLSTPYGIYKFIEVPLSLMQR